MDTKKFEVKFETAFWADHHGRHLRLDDVRPQSIRLNCPHCQVYCGMKIDSTVERFEKDSGKPFRRDNEEGISFRDKNLVFDFICSCPQCNNTVFVQAQAHGNAVDSSPRATDEQLEALSNGKILSVYPYRKSVTVPPEVPEKYAGDFREAVLVIEQSPTASAALSRRVLQNILNNEFGIQGGDLHKQIKAFIAKPDIPPYLIKAVDAIRNVGNFAAHPLKSTNTGEVVPVEPGEAEWLIEVLNSLFDFTFTQPLKSQERTNKLNAKLQDLGKPPML
ncbi:MAG: DUF4145 domain-containing protein [Cyanobacteriota bacterium]|nr:DUF4145 domain-containing protein [Cyanobacteriota bacterium]